MSASSVRRTLPRPRRRVALLVAVFVLTLCVVVAIVWSLGRAKGTLRQARAALFRGDPAAAIALLTDAESHQRDHAEIQYLLAKACRRAGIADQARLHLCRAEELGWLDEDLRREEWLAVAQSGHVDAVQKNLMEAIDQGAPDDIAEEIYEAVAKGHLAAYRVRDAWECLDTWLQWRPAAPSARLLRARLLESIGRFVPAVDDYRAALERLPDCHEARVRLAQLLLQLDEVEEARGQLQMVLDAAPQNISALVGMVQCTAPTVGGAEARRWIEAALAEDLSPSQRAMVLEVSGRLLLNEGKTREAVAELSEAARLDSRGSTILQALAAALARDGQAARAEECHQRAQALLAQFERLMNIRRRLLDRPNDADLRCEQGTILIGQGLTGEGIAWLQSALECDPAHGKTHQALAEYYAAAGDQQRAAHHRLMAAMPPAKPKGGK